jgi:GTP-binding protein
MKIKDVKLARTAFLAEDLIRDDMGKIVFMGRSNVGKSSLINKLVNRKNLARTSSKPGKTISVNYYLINDQFYFVDLPGYGFAKVSREDRKRVKGLISHFFEHMNNIRLILILIDSRRGFMDADLDVLSKIVNKNFKLLTVLTKSDKLKTSILQNQISILQQSIGLKAIPFSIKSNDDRLEILKYIKQSLKE